MSWYDTCENSRFSRPPLSSFLGVGGGDALNLCIVLLWSGELGLPCVNLSYTLKNTSLTSRARAKKKSRHLV